MGRKSILDLSSEETLAECVRKYPCLYDKTCKHYKDKHCVENAWAEVDKELGYEEGMFIFFSPVYMFMKRKFAFLKSGVIYTYFFL